MERQKSTQILVIAILSVAILTMSIGFATMTRNLTVSGNAHIEGSTWNVSFDTAAANTVVTSGSVTENKPTVAGTSVTFDVTFDTFGQYYEFTVPVHNYGTYNAELDAIVMSTLTTEQDDYLNYTVSYTDSTPTTTAYTASTSTGLAKALNAGADHTVKVRVEYVEPANPANLPGSTVTVPLTATLQYKQKLS